MAAGRPSLALRVERGQARPGYDALHIRGKSAHDAAHVAAMQAHGMQTLLTFDAADFARFQALINVLHPEHVAAQSA